MALRELLWNEYRPLEFFRRFPASGVRLLLQVYDKAIAGLEDPRRGPTASILSKRGKISALTLVELLDYTFEEVLRMDASQDWPAKVLLHPPKKIRVK